MKISERGQITIPKHFREQYGLDTSVEIEIVAHERGILITKGSTKSHPADELFGILNGKSGTDELIEDLRGR